MSNAPPGAVVAPGWRHQTLPNVKRANDFALESDDGQQVVKVTSSSAASSWLTVLDIDPSKMPVLRWRWKVSRSLPGSDLQRKAGDDYAARLYVMFDLPAERLSPGDRLRLQAARLLSGADVPAAALCYVWGFDQPVGSTGWNPYTDRVRMIVVDSGDVYARQWREVSRNVERDWSDAFGGAIPRINGLAIGADTDNTADTVTAWFGDLRFLKEP
ncbi:MAG: DUF3047 domain-containing protein [Lautropia sp.]|nr:DUF3047 domain-containing protein [Lautropia sp.]